MNFNLSRYFNYQSRRLARWLLLVVWALTLPLTLTKPVMMDDVTYLDVAQNIVQQPIHPSHLLLRDNTTPSYDINQPYFLFYQFAAVIKLSGLNELALHGVIAIWSLIAIFGCYRLLRIFIPRSALLFTVIFAWSPWFLPGQNLMTDVPLVALWLWVAAWLCDLRPPNIRRDLGLAIGCGLAILTKYTALVLLPLLLIDYLLRRQWRRWWVMAIPLIMIAGWSVFNLIDYGQIHLLHRSTGGSYTGWYQMFFGSLIIIGCVFPLGAMWPLWAIPSKIKTAIWAATIIIAIGLGVDQATILQHDWAHLIIRTLGLAIGGITLASSIWVVLDSWRRAGSDLNRQRQWIILATWLLGTLGFIVYLAPFPAVRHILLIMPIFIIIVGTGVDRLITKQWLLVGIVLTIGLGVLLAVSDWQWGNVNRVYAQRLAAEYRGAATVWTVGRRGWQWYGPKFGLRLYHAGQDQPKSGDYFIVPSETVNPQTAWIGITPPKLISSFTVKASPWLTLRTMTPDGNWGLYVSFIKYTPWTISRAPREIFSVYRFP